jgi:hypothetical protein
MAGENAEDLTANVLIGRSVMHRATIGFARHRSYGRTATMDNIAQPRSNLAFAVCPLSSLLAQSGHWLVRCKCPLLGAKRTWLFALQMSAFDPKRTSLGLLLDPFLSTSESCYDRLSEPRGRQ